MQGVITDAFEFVLPTAYGINSAMVRKIYRMFELIDDV
jgi:hypothetical protein